MSATIQAANIVASDQAYDARPAAMPLAAIIGFYLAVRLVLVLLAVRVLGQDAQSGVLASLALNYLLFLLAAFHTLGPTNRTLRSMVGLPCFRWVLLFLGFSGISLLWTVSASLPAAVAFWFAMAADTAVVVLLLQSGETDSVVNSLMRGYICGACAVAALAWIMPAQNDLRLGDEELLGPNQIGWVCAFAFFFAQYLLRQRIGNWTPAALLLAITLLRSLSKTTILAFLAAQIYILIRDRSMSRGRKLALTLSALIVVIAFSSLLANYFDRYTNTGTQSESLTGRLGIWAYFMSEALDKPWFGHGFHSVWKVIPPFYDGFEARHAHNELLQQFYVYGAAGIFMLVAIYLSVYRQICRISDHSLKVFLLGMLVFVLVRGLADTEAFDLSLPLWFITIIGALIEQSRRREEACV